MRIIDEEQFSEFKPEINLNYFSKEYINESYLNLIKN